MDIFYEQFLTKDYEFKRKKIESSKQALLVLSILNLIFLGKIIALMTIFIYIIVSLIARMKFIEYEYELTNNELVISKIINKKSRKIVANIKINEVIKVRPINSINNDITRLINLSLDGISKKGLNEKILIVQEDSNLVGYKIAMDKKLQEICKKLNPNAFKQQINILNELE